MGRKPVGMGCGIQAGAGVNCPTCKHPGSHVFRSMPLPDGTGIRRTRRCDRCGDRYSTIELLEVAVKKDREQLATARKLAQALEYG